MGHSFNLEFLKLYSLIQVVINGALGSIAENSLICFIDLIAVPLFHHCQNLNYVLPYLAPSRSSSGHTFTKLTVLLNVVFSIVNNENRRPGFRDWKFR